MEKSKQYSFMLWNLCIFKTKIKSFTIKDRSRMSNRYWSTAYSFPNESPGLYLVTFAEATTLPFLLLSSIHYWNRVYKTTDKP